MNKNPKKKRILWPQFIGVVFYVLIGAVCGFLIAEYLDWGSGAEWRLSEELLALSGFFLGMYAAMFVQIIIHETGHLVFGLLSGYQFCSFRIFRFMWVFLVNT